MPSEFYRAPFQIDHIIAEQHGGKSVFSNLALACFHCNLGKGPNIAGRDPSTHRTTRLFHPRRDQWEEHFHPRGATILGQTAIGRTTIHVLNVNHPAYLLVRRALIDAGLFYGSRGRMAGERLIAIRWQHFERDDVWSRHQIRPPRLCTRISIPASIETAETASG